MSTIFVQIASYKDPELIPTIFDLIQNAKTPNSLRIVVCWQHGNEQSLTDFENNNFSVIDNDTITHDSQPFNIIKLSHKGATIELIDVPYNKTKGACWARNFIQQLYDGEDYTLQLDSHHRFIDNWDIECINMLESLRDDDIPKPLLTAYLPSYDPNNDPKSRVQTPWKMNFDKFIPEGAVFFLPAYINNYKKLDKPIKARFYSGHFCFTDGTFCEEVQHDPEYFFHGEEINLAVRAFTHGYDLFHPHKIIAWHEYTRKDRVKMWDEHTRDTKQKGLIEKDWVERNNLSHNRNRIFFGMDGRNREEINFGKYDLGNVRSLADYEMYAGLSFKDRAITQETRNNKEPSLPKTSYEEWRKTLLLTKKVSVNSSINCDIRNVKLLVFAIHDKDDETIFRKDFSQSELKRYINSSTNKFNYKAEVLCKESPSYYVLWVNDINNNWLDRIAIPING